MGIPTTLLYEIADTLHVNLKIPNSDFGKVSSEDDLFSEAITGLPYRMSVVAGKRGEGGLLTLAHVKGDLWIALLVQESKYCCAFLLNRKVSDYKGLITSSKSLKTMLKVLSGEAVGVFNRAPKSVKWAKVNIA